jgi:hypothetical protein
MQDKLYRTITSSKTAGVHGVLVGCAHTFMNKVKRKIDYLYLTEIAIDGFMLLAIGAMLSLVTACAHTIAPRPIVSTTASIDTTGKPTSGIIKFYSDGVEVDQHWMDRYNLMVDLNNQKPDMVNGQPNPNKVFIAGKEHLGIKSLPNGNSKVSYIVLSYFDRLNQSLKANRKS